VEERDNCSLESIGNDNCGKSSSDPYDSVGYTRTLDKAYRFFQDGHIRISDIILCQVNKTMFVLGQVFYHL